MVNSLLTQYRQLGACRAASPCEVCILTLSLSLSAAGNLELLAAGSLAASYWDWESGRRFRFVKDHEDVPEEDGGNAQGKDNATDDGMEKLPLGRRVYNPTFEAADISIPFTLATADSFRTPYTNYVRG